MAVARGLPTVLGALAVLATTALFIMHIILARSLAEPSSATRATAIVSSILEAVVLLFLGWCLFGHFFVTRRASARAPLRTPSGLWFGLGALSCTVAAATSVAALVCLGRVASDLPTTILGSTAVSFLAGASVALGIAFASQLVFLVVHFALARVPAGQAQSLHTDDGAGAGSHRSPQPRVKSIPYSQTSPVAQKLRGSLSMDYSRSPPGSSGGRSAAETMSSIRSSLSHVVRPISSKTRLLAAGGGSSRQSSTWSQRSSGRRPTSLDSTAYRDTVSSMAEDGFDSWDTSAVDPQNRQTVLETSSPPSGTRFLETIPASPTTSRSPSPGTPLDLDPPRLRRRSRSYSPAASTRTRSGTAGTASGAATGSLMQQPNTSEAHIHPLFRSDSPTPPPAVMSAGTVVTAAPNAGQVVVVAMLPADRHSIRSLSRNRMRSGSLPAVPSPLSRQGSLDDFRKVNRSQLELREEEEREADGEAGARAGAGSGDDFAAAAERKMTPPLPEWILGAGNGAKTNPSGGSSSNSSGRRVRIEPFLIEQDGDRARGRERERERERQGQDPS